MNKNDQEAIKRREETLKKLNALGIDHCEGLPLIDDYKLCKSENQICKRFIASHFFSLLAYDYVQNHDYYETSSEILDMIDLYYNYHWACVDHRINPQTKCGELNEEVVMERRRALEWLICKDKNWDRISLDT